MNQNATHKDKIEQLRAAMAEQGVDGFIVPRADEWQGEFVAEYAERLRWISGFTGSGGAAVILRDKAALMTDSRYTLQAAAEVDSDMFEVVNYVETPMAKWISALANKGGVIGYDPRLHTPKQLQDLTDQDVELKAVENLIDEIWADQPLPPASTVEKFPEEIAGMSHTGKLAAVAKKLREHDLDAFVITLPDSIGWLLNIRAWDTKYIPIALSYLVLRANGEASWFIDPSRVPFDLENVNIIHPDEMLENLARLEGNVGLDYKRSPDWFRLTLDENGAQVVDEKDPSIDLKAIKNAAEQKAIKHAHIRDGVAVTKFLCWLEHEGQGEELSELSAAEKLREFRAQDSAFLADSFPTISGFGANGAVVHYRATQANNAPVSSDGLLLVDSGAQYQDGTTDITRTILIGEATQEMKENFTRVLQGHIAVALGKYKKGTTGKEIDALARAPLQEVDLNFAHGTGHGVGCFLAVHEEAANLSPRGEDALQAGMLLSNEPGYYKEGEYGIRIENLVLAYEVDNETLGFETVSFAPIDYRLIVKDMLSGEELQWLNSYHDQTRNLLDKYLNSQEREWLKTVTQKL